MQCFLLPGKALGPFRLGATLRECISELQFNSRDFKQVNTVFNINDETKDDIVLDIKTCGIYLRFDSIQQRLKLIDVYDLTKITIYYHKQLLTAPPSSLQQSSSSTSSPKSPQNDSNKSNNKINKNNNNASKQKNKPEFIQPNPSKNDERDQQQNKKKSKHKKSSKKKQEKEKKKEIKNKNEDENTFARIYNIMGLTHPGYYDNKRGLYYVEYDGLWLAFLLNYDPGPSSLPVDLDNGTSPILNRLIVFYGKNGFLSHTLPPLGEELSMIQANKHKPSSIHLYSYYFEPIYVTLNEGIKLGWRNRTIRFGTSVQDVLSDIGPPYKVFYKFKSLSSKNTISNTQNNDENDYKHNINTNIHSMHQDYFFNYIDLGLDILFDGYSHVVKKFILHTNNIGHPDFNRWCKCNFHIILFNDTNCVITSNSKWQDILKYMGSNTGPPIMYRSSHGKIQNVSPSKDNKPVSPTNTHQSIKIYAYQSVLFEIMGNQSISTVTLFHDRNYQQLQSQKQQRESMRYTQVNTQQMGQQVNSVLFEDVSIYQLPTQQAMEMNYGHGHHARINPSPLSKSIEEAATSQLEFNVEDKYQAQMNKHHKDKKRRKEKKRRKDKERKKVHTPEVAAVEIDTDSFNAAVNSIGGGSNEIVKDVVVDQVVGGDVMNEVVMDRRENEGNDGGDVLNDDGNAHQNEMFNIKL